MHVIDKDGNILEHIYSSHDKFLEDIDAYIFDNFCFSVSVNDTIKLLDCVCGHLLYWQYKNYSEDSKAKLIYDGHFKQNEILQRLIKIGDSTPELVIYEFNGTSLYYSFNENDIEYVADSESFFATLEENSKLWFTKADFLEMGGEIILDEEDKDGNFIEFSWSSSVYFFMKNDNLMKMNEYLNKSILELNNIYSSFNLMKIDVES